MARRGRKGGANKSQLIREYMEGNPKAGPQAVAEALKASHGITVTPQFVSTVKSNDKRRKKKRGRKAAAHGTAGRNGGAKLSMDSLIAAKHFVDKMGGLEKAKSAVDSLAKLLG